MSGIGSVFSWKWVLILNGNLWSHNLIWLWALRILFKVYHFWICKHDNVDFISNVDSKAVDIWVRCAFKDDYNYICGPTFVKKRAKKVLAERSADFPPNMMIAISSILDSHFFWHKFRWLHHGMSTFQIPFRVTINGGVLTCHWWTKISHVLNFILIGFSLYFSSLLRHIRHIIITTGY